MSTSHYRKFKRFLTKYKATASNLNGGLRMANWKRKPYISFVNGKLIYVIEVEQDDKYRNYPYMLKFTDLGRRAWEEAKEEEEVKRTLASL